MGFRKILTIADFKNKVLAANQKFLDTDYDIEEGNVLRMSPIVLNESPIEYTTNGTDYYVLNSNIAQVANGSYLYRQLVSAGDKFNMRIKGGIATTVSSCKVELWLEV